MDIRPVKRKSCCICGAATSKAGNHYQVYLCSEKCEKELDRRLFGERKEK